MSRSVFRLRTLAPATFLLCALLLSACGGAASTAAPERTGPSPVAVAGIDAQHDKADIAFVTDMAPHHEGALAMATLADTRASNPQVKALAAQIKGAQAPEIATMAAMSRAWGVPAGGGGHMAMSMHDDAAALTPLTGAVFDREFLARMTVHHSSAVEMAQRELAGGSNPQAKKMAGDIVRSQTAEIARMRTLLQSL